MSFLAATLTDTDTVAVDKAAALIRDMVTDFHGIQAAVDLASERFQLSPEGLLAHHLPQLMIARVRGSQLRHAHQELQEAALRIGIAVGIVIGLAMSKRKAGPALSLPKGSAPLEAVRNDKRFW